MDENDVYRVMDLKALRCLWALGKRGTLTGAGIELGISEPAVSKRIKALEGHLGAKLYESGGGKVRLTVAGERTFAAAVDLFGRIEDFERNLESLEVAGSVTISAQDSVQLYLLPDVIRSYCAAYPRVTVRILTHTAPQTIEQVQQDEVDIGITPRSPLPGDLVFAPWRTFPSYLLIPLDHPLVRRGRPTLLSLLNRETLLRYPLIVPGEDRLRIASVLEHRGLPMNVAFEVATAEAVKRYVARSLGIGIASGICLTEEDTGTLVAVQIPDEFQGQTVYGAVLRRGRYVGRALAGFLEVLGLDPRPA